MRPGVGVCHDHRTSRFFSLSVERRLTSYFPLPGLMLLQLNGFSREFISFNVTCKLISSDRLRLFCCALFQMLGGYGDFLYQTGMIDELQRDYVDQQTSLGVKLIQQQKWIEAFEVNHRLMNPLNYAFTGYSFTNSPSFGQTLEIFVSVSSFASGCRFVRIFFLVSGL